MPENSIYFICMNKISSHLVSQLPYKYSNVLKCTIASLMHLGCSVKYWFMLMQKVLEFIGFNKDSKCHININVIHLDHTR